FGLMVETRVRQDFEAGAHGTTLRVIATVDQARDAGLNDRAGAHAARLNRDVEGRAGESVVAQGAGSFAYDDNLSVRRGVAITDGAIAGARDYGGVVDDDGADRYFSSRHRAPSFLERLLHEFEIGVHASERIACGLRAGLGARLERADYQERAGQRERLKREV